MQHLVTGLEPARIEGGSGAGLQRTSRADQPAFEIQESDYRKSGIDKSGPIEGAELASARGRAPPASPPSRARALCAKLSETPLSTEISVEGESRIHNEDHERAATQERVPNDN